MSTRSSTSRNSVRRSADNFDTRSQNSLMSCDRAMSRNRTSYGTFTNGKPAVQMHSVRETRENNFRETLRKLLRKNENVFGKTQSFDEGVQLIRDH